MPALINLNGKLMATEQASLPLEDRGVLFGDGVYEVLAVYNGNIRAIEQHRARLGRSLEGIQLTAPALLSSFNDQLYALLKANNLEQSDACIYLQVTRGLSEPRDFNFDPKAKPNFFIRTKPFTFPQLSELKKGFKALAHADTRRLDCYIKSTCLQPSVLLRRKAAEAGCEEAILHRNNLLTEGSSSNVFLVKDGTVYTPQLSNTILSGVTRTLIIDICTPLGIAVVEKDIPFEDLYEADEIFISSTTRTIKPIITLDGHMVGDGKPGLIWQSIIHAYLKAMHNLTH